ncbi:MAG: hypothetical protein AABY83_09710 [Pseudomonadota bacterium]
MMKRIAVGTLSVAMMMSGPVAYAANPVTANMVLTGTIVLTATVAAASGAGGAGGAGVSNFNIPVSAGAPASIAALFTVTYSANGSTGNTVKLQSTAGTASNLVNGVNLVPYTLTCAACSVAGATALSGVAPGTLFDTVVTPVSAKVLSFQFNFTAGTDLLPAGAYTDTIVVTVTAA